MTKVINTSTAEKQYKWISLDVYLFIFFFKKKKRKERKK